MSGSLSLVPRKVAKTTARSHSSQPKDNSSRKVSQISSSWKEAATETQTIGSSVELYNYRHITRSGPKGKGKATGERTLKYTDTDYARLLCLALSDYALQSDTDLRRVIVPRHRDRNVGGSNDSDNYAPLNEVLKRFPLHYDVKSPTRSLMVGMVKALRKQAAELVDVRLMLADSGGYELRRKDWTMEHVPPGLSYSQQQWDQRTVYIECIPPDHRSVPGIIQFLTNLLEEKAASTVHPWARIQGVTLPQHHQDQTGDPPMCKDFCLVTFADIDDAVFLTSQWQWARNASESMNSSKGEKGDVTQGVKDAIRFGFRSLSRAEWEKLREQYLAFRSKILSEISEYEEASMEAQRTLGKRKLEGIGLEFHSVKEEGEPMQSKVTTAVLTPDSPYPYGCLVFIRNIHPETNKTALRTLFSSAFKSGVQNENRQSQLDGLDYIDYSKGMNSCYLRLSTPTHTDLLVQHFEKQRIAQLHALDDKGTSLCPSGDSDKAIMVEKIAGKKEEVYWERVPEKVRKQAVQKVIASLAGDAKQNAHVVSEHPRKRRKN